MSTPLVAVTTGRILRQLRGDPRTVGMILVIPVVLLALLYFMYENRPSPPGGETPFNHIGITMLGILPFALMFLVTSIAMLRERTSGTLERLMTTPSTKLDILGGYGAAFSVAAALQVGLACAVGYGLLSLDTAGSPGYVLLIAVVDAVLGVGLGLLCSAFARTEFQAVQFMPVVVIPQLFLCGLFVARSDMPSWLEWVSRVLPLTYAVDALNQVADHASPTGQMWRDVVVVIAFTVVALASGAASLRRRTP